MKHGWITSLVGAGRWRHANGGTGHCQRSGSSANRTGKGVEGFAKAVWEVEAPSVGAVPHHSATGRSQRGKKPHENGPSVGLRTSDRDRCLDRRMMAVVDECEIVEFVVEDRVGSAPDRQGRIGERRPRQLFADLFGMVVV